MIFLSFCLFLCLFSLVGFLSVLKKKNTSRDYLLANQEIKPWLAAVSAIATSNSGYMFIGQIGFTYVYGLQSVWLMVGLIFGDFVSSLFVHKNLRKKSQELNVVSFANLVSKWHGKNYKYVQLFGGLIILIFLSTYAAAQLNAGSKSMHILFGLDYRIGAIIGGIIVLLYCFSGGIRASIWTDAAQSFVMIVAMFLMVIYGINELGGLSTFINELHKISPNYMKWFPSSNFSEFFLAPFMFIIGWFFSGVGVIGQPHVMVRFMTIDNTKNIPKTRIYYYTWYTLFYSLTILAAFVARLLIPETNNMDPELALPTLAQNLLPEFFVGIVLAGIFAATMSTADSQILACTASITNDLLLNKKNNYLINKLVTLIITVFVVTIAINDNNNVFNLVLMSWSTLACCFSPLLIVNSFKQNVSEFLSLMMMVIPLITLLLWRHYGLNEFIYEVAPGIMSGILTFLVFKLLRK
ncbi:MAG: High-affinity proline transporter PutP [Alphaproteobacteria bacterium MarineAlpha8_Bin1]|nr:MAG: High-affinity proline transporter PutP [Alphaproteobacteria bacterium MarineAlpha8_Bin1]